MITLRHTPPPRPQSDFELPSPGSFGNLFPPKFSSWRGDQPRAVVTTIDSPYRFIAQAAPTGFGKSFVYASVALLTGRRTCILTSTKGLQEQLLADFNSDGVRRIVDIRGQGSYPCVRAKDFGLPGYTTCDHAPCHAGVRCADKDRGCLYYDQYREASAAPIVLTNYDYWLSIHKYGQGLGTFDMLVLDEAHDAPDKLADFMSIELAPPDFASLGIRLMDPGCDITQWREWALFNLPSLQSRVDSYKSRARRDSVITDRTLREFRTAKRVLGKLEDLAVADDTWVIEKVDKGLGHGRTYIMKFDATWPYKQAEKYLFRGINKVVLVSATLRRKTCTLLGIEDSDLDFYDYDSSFPKSRRPIIHVPTAQMNHRTPPDGIQTWLRRIDHIVGARLDRKGIIHTVSFDRARRIVQASAFSKHMLINESGTTRSIVEQYKCAPPPCILVTPSVTTGYDFPYTECEYQIIGKLPFPDNRAKVVKARTEADKTYTNYVTMQTLIQECGRGMRAIDDMCETIIIDDSIEWFMRMNHQFAPRWFSDAIIWASVLPPPPPKLERNLILPT